MNRYLVIMVLLLIFIMPNAWGAASQYSDPNRETLWNSITDSMNTIGQTPYQAKYTKMRLRSQRAHARLESYYKSRR